MADLKETFLQRVKAYGCKNEDLAVNYFTRLDNDLKKLPTPKTWKQINFEDLKAYAAEMIKMQMAQFGQMDPSTADIDGIVARVLGNPEEVKRLSDQVMSEKMLALYKSKVKSTVKELNYQEFVAASYGE